MMNFNFEIFEKILEIKFHEKTAIILLKKSYLSQSYIFFNTNSILYSQDVLLWEKKKTKFRWGVRHSECRL